MWGSATDSAATQAEGAAAVIWLEAYGSAYLSTYVAPGVLSDQGAIVALRGFSAPVRRLDVRRYLEDHFHTDRHRAALPRADRVLPMELPERVHLTIADHACRKAFAVMVGGEALGPPSGLAAYSHRPVTSHRFDAHELGSSFQAAAGKRLFSAQACTTCHSIDGSRKVGPSVLGTWGAEQCVEGQSDSVRVDAAYVHRSIVRPQADITCGYPNVMPAYPNLGDPQLDALTSYIMDLNGASPF